jgi:hypothetical protein
MLLQCQLRDCDIALGRGPGLQPFLLVCDVRIIERELVAQRAQGGLARHEVEEVAPQEQRQRAKALGVFPLLHLRADLPLVLLRLQRAPLVDGLVEIDVVEKARGPVRRANAARDRLLVHRVARGAGQRRPARRRAHDEGPRLRLLDLDAVANRVGRTGDRRLEDRVEGRHQLLGQSGHGRAGRLRAGGTRPGHHPEQRKSAPKRGADPRVQRHGIPQKKGLVSRRQFEIDCNP